MATYGKKGRSLLPSFSALRDPDPGLATKRKKDKFMRQGSKVTLSVFRDGGKESQTAHHDDSVEEMASMLLNDTVAAQSSVSPSKGLPQPGPALGAPPILTQTAPATENSTPRSSALIVNGKEISPLKSPPVATESGSCDATRYSTTPARLDSTPSSSPNCPTNYTKNGPAISTPRRISKRKSMQLNSSISSPANIIGGQSRATSSANRIARSISTPNHLQQKSGLHASSPMDAADINGKIEAMLAATNSLKATQGSVTPANKRLRDSAVLVRMKSVLSNHLNTTGSRNAHDPARDDRLLNDAISNMPDLEDGIPDLFPRPTSLEIRINEGDNFSREKVPQITGHGTVKRKPIAGDIGSLKSRMSSDNLSGGGCRSSNQRGMPTVSALPRSHTDLAQFKENKSDYFMEDLIDLESTFSSSPLGQSTPRIRVQPTFVRNDRQTRDKTPDDASCLFDSDSSLVADHPDMDIDTEPVYMAKLSTTGIVKRKGSERRGSKGRLRSNSRKWKKHPSPSKSDLEHLEQAFLHEYPNLRQTQCFNHEDGLPHIPSTKFTIGPVLAMKDPNEGVVAPQGAKKAKNGLALFEKSHPTRSTESMPDLNTGRKVRRLSLISKLSRPSNSIRSKRDPAMLSRDHAIGDSAMEIDELQLNDPAFDIAMKS